MLEEVNKKLKPKNEKRSVDSRRIARKRTHVRDERSNAEDALLFSFLM
jgi:hypothetical protein